MDLDPTTLFFFACAPLCILLEALRPRVHTEPRWSRDSAINLLSIAIKGSLQGLAAALGSGLTRLLPHPGIGGWPFALQCVIVLVVLDGKQYAYHMLQHRVAWLWRMHRIHHSTRHLNWLALGRTHFGEFFVFQLLTTVLLVWALAVDLKAYMFGYALPNVLFAGFIAHLNVNVPRVGIGWGSWIGRLVVTPNYHAHHHGLHPRAVNLAEILPLWDHLFGTYEVPPAPLREFGLYGEPEFPMGLLAQQLSPFRRKAP